MNPWIRKILKPLYYGARRAPLLAAGTVFRPGGSASSLRNPRKILIVQPARVGDLVLTLPLFEMLRTALPAARLFVVGSGFANDLLLGNPHVDRVFPFGRMLDHAARPTWSEFRRFFENERFDVALDADTSDAAKSSLFITAIRPKRSVGYDVGGKGTLYSDPLPFPTAPIPLGDLIAGLARPLGITGSPPHPRVHLLPGERDRAVARLEALSPGAGRRIGFHPGATYPSQRVPVSAMADAARRLHENGSRILVLTGPGEENLRREFSAALGGTPHATLSPRTLRELISNIAALDLLVCNNSGPLHLAGAVGTPTVSTIGPTVTPRFLPVGERQVVLDGAHDRCSACRGDDAQDHVCLAGIDANDLVRASVTLLG